MPKQMTRYKGYDIAKVPSPALGYRFVVYRDGSRMGSAGSLQRAKDLISTHLPPAK